ncbi:hypothetical protein MXB_1821, partial [Myxobolus squamalis]
MMRDSKPKRDAQGNILKAAEFQTKSKSGEVSRVEPNRKWFGKNDDDNQIGNTRVINQAHLQNFISEANTAKKDPYKVILKPGKLPLSLLLDYKKIQPNEMMPRDMCFKYGQSKRIWSELHK